ncbi:tRNA (N6-threonylcarbamoyladenosine(37)-N6)-methyltransferase TrmO [Shewanella sp. D64]|uniref:tRNA (N6-threonylcarbamoyladenosine(37)-N6)-methyltransferase TrmO n=1 Tax=unclassified Shewanella TaxID=196818 RepID=UPI0022BA175E|nr:MULTISPECIES: tRNA (N6-threonylcarbamoyladenosine(37)-N6)-methyltransferase TrmO [unclassified Shewanella]MEC4726885.1 tRNA (N6-threonylcarbamoyladenosine(37)-N6)-methyltransferase TrmO [Shewanella sp. D64]MEC4738618.1 tRNA (N6-threonylcarbamoyladenosine(37)-N6)-methyltransferase TrmO [Shewanella sp. E94]WBJ93834.1 tRNA (N6-threonylcarbamoyladenosine(37)-N6)-methyltransferase TrmO [Shewanella sp. MTB7]
MTFTSQIQAVALCRTPYKQKFGIPRQPGLVTAARGFVELQVPFNHIDAVRGLEQYSHLWLLFSFHENLSQGWKTTVRPPRLGGNEKLGVFATRSTFRPNGIGQSVVKLHKIHHNNGVVSLEISGMDLLDGTPVIDIKPYIPFSDSIADAQGGIAHEAPALAEVQFSEHALQQVIAYEKLAQYPRLAALIQGVLAQDPRPAYKKAKADPKEYQVALYDLDILWHMQGNTIVVTELRAGPKG